MNFVVYFVTTGVINYILFDFLNQKYCRKYNKLINTIILFFYTMIISICNLLNMPILNFFLNAFLFLIIDICFFTHDSIKDYYEDIVYLFMLVLLDSVSYFLVGFIYKTKGPEFTNIFRSLSSTILVIFANIVLKKYFIESSNSKDVPLKEIFLYFIITLFYLFFIYNLSESYDSLNSNFSKIITIIVVIGQVMIDIIIYCYTQSISQMQKVQKQVLEANKQIELNNIYYKTLKKNNEKNRKLIHDLKNYIQTLENSYELNNLELSKKLQSQIEDKIMNQDIDYNTSSEILDIILNDKEHISKSNNIKFEYRMEFVNLGFIEEIDVITIFGNLYDNAIEANASVKNNRYISTYIYYFKKMLIIKIENSCNNELQYVGEKLISTKDGHIGIGTQNISKTVRKYNGLFDLKIKEGVCKAIIMLPVS